MRQRKTKTEVESQAERETEKSIYLSIYLVVVSLTLIETTFFGSGHVFQLKLLQQNKLNWWIIT